jgi:tetratricopeptide (TPR) repeat protein
MWNEALTYYDRSRAINEEIGYRAGLGRALDMIAWVYFSQGLLDEALAYYERSLKIDEEIGHQAGQANTLYRIAGVYEKQARLGDAEKAITQAVTIFEALESPELDNARKQLDKVRALQRIAAQK